MTPELTLALRQNIGRRAHLAGAEAAELDRQAIAALNRNELRAGPLAYRAMAARRRYFRELEAIDLLGGLSPSPFAPLG